MQRKHTIDKYWTTVGQSESRISSWGILSIILFQNSEPSFIKGRLCVVENSFAACRKLILIQIRSTAPHACSVEGNIGTDLILTCSRQVQTSSFDFPDPVVRRPPITTCSIHFHCRILHIITDVHLFVI